jgi:thiamine-phosphate pyrophosphorylase
VSARSNSPAARTGPILCYVTDRGNLSPAPPSGLFSALLQKIATIASAGVDWIQLREKDLPARALSSLAGEASRTVQHSGRQPGKTRMLVNDRVDVALAQHADGVHLGENGLPVRDVKQFVQSRLLPKSFLLGVSCHSLEAAKSAESDGADYIFFGPIYATPSKSAFGVPQGVGRLAEVCRSVSIPAIAIGGITLGNAAACIAAGAAGIAAIRLFQDAPDSAAIVEELRRTIA